MGKAGAPEKLIMHGKRLDSRKLDEFRPMEAAIGVIPQSRGSATFSFGDTHAIVGVQGPGPMHPKGLQEPTRTKLRCHYFMAPFATSERGRPGRSRRSTEISMVIGEALSNVIFLEEYPKTALDIFMEILQANASTRCAALNAASMALAEAGIPMKDLISSLSVGKADGQILLDVAGAEDNFGDVDMAVATVGGGDAFVLLQMDGVITLAEFRTMLDMAKHGCAVVHKKQKEALMKHYNSEEVSL